MAEKEDGPLWLRLRGREGVKKFIEAEMGNNEPVKLPDELPVRTPSREALLKRIEEQIENTFALPRLDAALRRPPPDDPRAELQEIVRELYLRIHQTREPATVLERSAIDQPDLFALFFVQTRRRLLERLTTYLRRRIERGAFHSVIDPTTAARFLLESVTFFAPHRYSGPDLQPGDDETARETVVQLLVRSFTGERNPSRPATKKGRKASEKRNSGPSIRK